MRLDTVFDTPRFYQTRPGYQLSCRHQNWQAEVLESAGLPPYAFTEPYPKFHPQVSSQEHCLLLGDVKNASEIKK